MSNLKKFTDAMHAVTRENRPENRLHDLSMERLLEILGERVAELDLITEDCDLSSQLKAQVAFCTTAVALCAAEIARRVKP